MYYRSYRPHCSCQGIIPSVDNGRRKSSIASRRYVSTTSSRSQCYTTSTTWLPCSRYQFWSLHFILISDQKILGNSFQPIGGHITGKVTEDVIGQIYYIWFPRILWYDCKFNVKIVLFSKIKQNGQASQTSFVEFRLHYVWQKHNTY